MTAPVTYIPNFISNPDEVFADLWSQLDWERRVFIAKPAEEGAPAPPPSRIPRREYWTNTLNRSYTYGSGVGARTYDPRPTHPHVTYIAALLAVWLEFEYEGCFLNGYETERDALGWHADDDPGINHARPIAVVTVGAGRAIQFMEKGTGERGEVFLEPGSLLLMHAGMQSTHLHRIPKVGRQTDPRVSLTYRGLIA